MIWLIIALVVAGVMLIGISWELHLTSKALLRAERRADDAEAVASQLDQQLATVLVKVAPLIEKTDWMTGRWGGKFDQLVALENKRNNTIDIVRRALMNTPTVINTAISENLLPKIGRSL